MDPPQEELHLWQCIQKQEQLVCVQLLHAEPNNLYWMSIIKRVGGTSSTGFPLREETVMCPGSYLGESCQQSLETRLYLLHRCPQELQACLTSQTVRSIC